MFNVSEQPQILASCRLVPITDGSAETLSRVLVAMDPWRTLGYRSTGLFGYLTRPDPGLYRRAVVVDDALAGVLCVRYPWLHGPFLELLAVLPLFKGRGTGAHLLAWLEDKAQSVAPNLWTTVSSFNTEAQRFYRRHGFEPVARLDGLIQPNFDEILLRKVLRHSGPASKGPTILDELGSEGAETEPKSCGRGVSE